MKIKQMGVQEFENFSPRSDSIFDFEQLGEFIETEDLLESTAFVVDGEVIALAGSARAEWGVELYVIPSELLEHGSRYTISVIRAARDLTANAAKHYGTVFAHCPKDTWERWIHLMGFELDTIFSLESGECYLRFRRDG